MQLILNESNATLTGKVPAEIVRLIDTATAYRVDGWFWSPRVQSGKWDGYTRLLKKAGDTYYFPAGLARRVISLCHANGIFPEVIDRRNKPEAQPNRWSWTYPHDLRAYQIEAVEVALKRTRGIWELPTGSGKMLTAAYLFYRLGLNGIITVLTEEAINDTVREFENAFTARIGRWSAKKKVLGEIVVTTVPSLTSALRSKNQLYDHLLSTKVLIMDEVHYAGASTYSKLMKQAPAYYKIGQTGTAYRGDGKDLELEACIGPVLLSIKTSSLQKEGTLAKSEVYFYKSPAPVDHSYVRLSPQERYLESIVRNPGRNELIRKIFKSSMVPTVIAVKLLEHGEILAQLLGIPFVSGQSQNRQEIQENLNSGELNSVVATTIFDQSINIPRLERLINAAGQSPEARQTQRHGRVLRLFESKSTAQFIDFYDDWDEKVLDHTLNRISYMKKEGHLVHIEEYND